MVSRIIKLVAGPSFSVRSATEALSLALIGGWVVIAIAAPLVAPYDPNAVEIVNILSPPSLQHWFGTDQVGRDVFSRILYGARVDLLLCVAGVVPPMLLGGTIGIISGYFGGFIDGLLMRIYDLTVAFPFFVLLLAIVGVIGPGLWNFIIALTLVGWVTYARLARAEVLAIRNKEYIQAAQCLGYSSRVILVRHLLPNAVGPLLAYSVSDAVLVMLAGASFGFIGMGAQPPLSEWGAMIADGQTFVREAWWICLFPGLALISLGLGLSYFGNSLAKRRRN